LISVMNTSLIHLHHAAAYHVERTAPRRFRKSR
jgi:hypothetical protein